MQSNITLRRSVALSSLLAAVSQLASAAEPPAIAEFRGTWAFELPDGNPAWLLVRQADDGIEASLLWSVGSARPVQSTTIEDGRLTFERKLIWKPYGVDADARRIEKPFTARLVDGKLLLSVTEQPAAGGPAEVYEVSGKRMPPLPERPDLSAIKFGEPISLFNVRDLTGWKQTYPKKKNG